MIAEVKAEFPTIETILLKIHKIYYDRFIDYAEFKEIVLSSGVANEEFEHFLEMLFENQYLIGVNHKRHQPVITNISDLNRLINEKQFFIFDKNKIYLILNPMEYLLKNKTYLRS